MTRVCLQAARVESYASVTMAKQKDGAVRLLSVRVTEGVYVRIGRFRDKLARERPGSDPSVSDTVRVLIEHSLAAKS